MKTMLYPKDQVYNGHNSIIVDSSEVDKYKSYTDKPLKELVLTEEVKPKRKRRTKAQMKEAQEDGNS